MNERDPQRREPLSERALQRLLAMAAEGGDGEAPAAAPPVLPARYELVRELGRGGMGVVWEAIDHQLGRRCALKTLGAGAGTDDELRARFAREALAAARLRHPHIAAVHDATPDYISMQLVAGGPIGCAPSLPARAAVTLVRDAARALHHAHEQGIVHRDLKPSNLLVEGDHVFVVDFGLAKAIDAGASLSIAGAVVGTPAFMPPEQALGKGGAADPRSDVYGLGATLHWCLSGSPPFAAADLPALLRAVVEQEPSRLPGDRELALVVGKCLAKEPEQRYTTAAALADDLDRWLLDEPVHARPPSFRYRLQKRLQRQRALWRAAAAAVVLTALVLVPIVLRESAARSAASEAVELADHVAAVLRDAQLFVRLGDIDSSWQALDASVARVREFLGRHDVPRVRYLLSRLLRARGQDDDAAAALRLALDADPELADARFERGLLLAARRDLSDAERATAIADLGVDVRERSVLSHVDRLFGRAELARLQRDHALAMQLLQEVLEYDGMHLGARWALVDAANALGQTDLARYWSASFIDMQAGYAPFYLARERRSLPTTFFGLDGALVDFAATLDDAGDLPLGSAHRGLAHLRRALRMAAEGDAALALAAAQSAVDAHVSLLDPRGGRADGVAEPPGARNNLAVCRLVLERLLREGGDAAAAATERQQAEADLGAVIAAAPAMPEARFNLGLAHLRAAAVARAMGRADAAASRASAASGAFGKAIELAPQGWVHERAARERLAEAQALGGVSGTGR